jgi:hypothetical protein
MLGHFKTVRGRLYALLRAIEREKQGSFMASDTVKFYCTLFHSPSQHAAAAKANTSKSKILIIVALW